MVFGGLHFKWGEEFGGDTDGKASLAAQIQFLTT
jgi:hypothetical protein